MVTPHQKPVDTTHQATQQLGHPTAGSQATCHRTGSPHTAHVTTHDEDEEDEDAPEGDAISLGLTGLAAESAARPLEDPAPAWGT